MNYIYPITDPEILKLELEWALYDRPKPPEEERDNRDGHFYIDEWRKQSRIAYLKEPEFNVAEGCYKIEETGRFVIHSIDKGKVFIYTEYRHVDGHWVSINNLSHYYPGQEYDGEVKYVREVNIERLKAKHLNDDVEPLWQEVEEPEERTIIPGMEKSSCFGPDLGPEMTNPDHTQFQEGVNKGEILSEI